MKIIIQMFLFMIFFTGFEHVTGQGNPVRKPRLYNSWINSKGKYPEPKGFLYEIRDSSVVFSITKPETAVQPGALSFSQIPVENISILKTRRAGSVKRGAIIGGVLLGITAVAPFIPEIGKMDGFGIIIFPMLAAGGGAIGTGLGALFGSVKQYFPVNGSYDNFRQNRYQLEKYSYMNEYPPAPYIPSAGHRSFAGLFLGPAIPVGDFADKSPENPSAGYAKNDGEFGGFNLGLLLTDKFGVALNFMDGSFGVSKDDSNESWEIIRFMAGPMYSIPVSGMVSFEISPKVGSVDAVLFKDSKQIDEGKGLGFSFSSSVRFNIARRICLRAEPEFFTSRTKFDGNTGKGISSIGIGFGIGYRFR